VELFAEVAGVTPTLVAIPRNTIEAAGGQLFGANLYFGEFLDPPPHTEVVDKVSRILSITPTPFVDALRAGFAWYRAQPRRTTDYSFEDQLLASGHRAS
jgi:hypothetical protein